MHKSRTVIRVLLVAGVASLVVLSVTAAGAVAASETSLSVVTEDDSIVAGETTTMQIVIDDADGGAGAAEFRVALDDASTAEIVDATVVGSSRVATEMADDGSWIDIEYAFQNTADTGSVVIAEVTVEGVDTGATEVTLESAAGNDAVVVYDENGTGYSVTGTNSAELSVEDESRQQSSDESTDTTDSDSSDSGGASPSESEDTPVSSTPSNSADTPANDENTPVNNVDTASDEAASPTAEQSSGGETPAQSRADSGILDSVISPAGGPIGIAAVILIVFLIGLALARR